MRMTTLQRQRSKPQRSWVLAIVVTLGAAVAAIGSRVWRTDTDDARAAVHAAMIDCAPLIGSRDRCRARGLHDALVDGADQRGNGPYLGFLIDGVTIRCGSADCDARVKGRIAFAHRTFPSTLELVDHGKGWFLVSWTPDHRARSR